jgi:hypothetical protein
LDISDDHLLVPGGRDKPIAGDQDDFDFAASIDLLTTPCALSMTTGTFDVPAVGSPGRRNPDLLSVTGYKLPGKAGADLP